MLDKALEMCSKLEDSAWDIVSGVGSDYYYIQEELEDYLYMYTGRLRFDLSECIKEYSNEQDK